MNNNYFEWLMNFIGHSISNTDGSFLFQKKVYILLEKDQNRVEDALVLRRTYHLETGYSYVSEDDDYRCTFLELVIGIAKRIHESMIDLIPNELNNVGNWVKEMIDNVANEWIRSTWDKYRWDDMMETILSRTYEPDGKGNFFPVECNLDQREEEIWEQMNQYLIEKTSKML